jgi:hypothetical protein
MWFERIAKLATMASAALLFAGCAATPTPQDYTAYRESRPKSILVLPPVNNSPDVNGGISVLAQATAPLAESGYYVIPVTLMAETFKQNGLTTPADIHAVAPAKLQEIFGADAGLYITISKYGATYTVLNSVVVVTANAKLIDLKSGKVLWTAWATANNDNNGGNQGGLVGLLVTAIVNQIMNNVTDASHTVAGLMDQRLLSAGGRNSVLYGPRSPMYGKD